MVLSHRPHRREELRTLLEGLEPADALEQAHRARILALLTDAGDPFDREHFTPGHVTASAFVLDPTREHMLLILHAKLGRWLQPGGHVEADDSSVALAACREVLEETGLDVSAGVSGARVRVLDVDVHDIPARGAMPAHQHFDVRFAFDATHTEARAGSDATQARWVSIAELLSGGPHVPHLPTDESVMRAVRKLSRGLT